MEDTRADRGISGLNLAGRLNQAMRGEVRKGVKEPRVEGPRKREDPRGQGGQVADMARLDRKRICGDVIQSS